MRRRARSPKAKPAAKLPVARESTKNDGARVRDLEKRLAEAQEQLTATSEILRVISSSPTDVQPVFDAVARNARGLLHGHTVSVTRLVGEELQLMSYSTTSPDTDAVVRAFHPILL